MPSQGAGMILCSSPSPPTGPPPPPADRFSTLRGLEQSLNPQLNRYAHETDYLIGQARSEGRQPVFQLYPDIQVRWAMFQLYPDIQVSIRG